MSGREPSPGPDRAAPGLGPPASRTVKSQVCCWSPRARGVVLRRLSQPSQQGGKGRETACGPEAIPRSMDVERAAQILEGHPVPGRDCFSVGQKLATILKGVPRGWGQGWWKRVFATFTDTLCQRAQLWLCRHGHTRFPFSRCCPRPPLYHQRKERYPSVLFPEKSAVVWIPWSGLP